MIRIRDRERQRIAENSRRRFETNAVFGKIRLSFSRIPFKRQCHKSRLLRDADVLWLAEEM